MRWDLRKSIGEFISEGCEIRRFKRCLSHFKEDGLLPANVFSQQASQVFQDRTDIISLSGIPEGNK
jgi:hypothetical protein